ncbi:hypothetical protein [Phytomonospora endophytica]|uniref:Uncharacterized protein n=1 Tax=Phytomonospora endophytica TaxID=714109 RepID=A0A841FS66_9ACTN|nr:hypothetical protein [Phytomonospora endophytica]MBB6038644.1 hypothetical protein [Phytomonospora endophytica]GIG69211.1 hypothetical protein Pen01_55060 [Phytomonospora endophytica]
MTGKFHVNHSGMSSLTNKTLQLANVIVEVRNRTRKYARPDLLSAGSGLLIHELYPGVDTVYQQSERFGIRTGLMIGDLAGGVAASNSFYASGDARAGASFDGLIIDLGADNATAFAGQPKPDAKSTAYDLGCTWPEDPAIRDGAPQTSDAFKYEFNVLAGDILSISEDVAALCVLLFGRDPVEKFLKPFVGDWDQLYKAGVEFERYEQSVAKTGRNLQFLSNQIPVVWDGNAAGNAREHMLVLGQRVEQHAAHFKNAGTLLKQAAQDAYDAYGALSTAVKFIIDQMIPVANVASIVGKSVKFPAKYASKVAAARKEYDFSTKRYGLFDDIVKYSKGILNVHWDPGAMGIPDVVNPDRGGWFGKTKQGPYQPAK